MTKNIVNNSVDNKEYFVSVIPVKKSSQMLEIAAHKEAGYLGDYKEIPFEAFVYDNNEVKKLSDMPLESRQTEFVKIKPSLLIYVGVKENSTTLVQDAFQSQINELLGKVDVTNDEDLILKLKEIGYKASIDEIYSIFCSDNIKSVYIF